MLAAPKSAMALAHQSGVVQFEDAGDAMRLGKEYERQVLERIEQGEPVGSEFDVTVH